MNATVTMRVGGGGVMAFTTNTFEDLTQPPEISEHGVTVTTELSVNFFPYENLMYIGWTKE